MPARGLNFYCIIFTVGVIFFFLFIPSVRAQTPVGPPDFAITTTYVVSDPDVVDGDIISQSTPSGELKRSAVANDERLFGVAVLSPLVVYRVPPGDTPLARSGEVLVNVTDLGGEIAIGDFITSSAIPGKGQKAVELTGLAIGTALSTFNPNDGTKQTIDGKDVSFGQVKVSVSIQPLSLKAQAGLAGMLSRMMKNVQSPEGTNRFIRYVIAGIIAITAIAISFTTFGRNVTKGMESIGRNPLARTNIEAMIILNGILTIIVCLIAIGLSIFILRA